MPRKQKRYALISVSNKDGLEDFGRELIGLGFTLLASGGTARKLHEADIKVTITGQTILDHLVATLYHYIHAGLLADRKKHEAEMKRRRIRWIDLVCVDLYDLASEISRPGADEESVRGKTDVGGPTMLHGGAKGRRIVISSPDQRRPVLDWIAQGEPDAELVCRALAAEADRVAGEHILASAKYLLGGVKALYPEGDHGVDPTVLAVLNTAAFETTSYKA